MLMTKMKIINKKKIWLSVMFLLTAVFSVIIIHSCAKLIHPEGGPKDETPPKLLKSMPLHGSTNFRGKEIKLTFDKEIVVKNIYNQLIITPNLPKIENDRSYTFKTSGNTLTLSFKNPLPKDTTYTFNFGGSIQGTTEGNCASNIILNFSTGDDIDDFYVKGIVSHLLTMKTVSKAYVMLYRIEDDSTIENKIRDITNSSPDYFVKTDENGKFIINYISRGKYRICAAEAVNNKMQIDMVKDEYGFLKELINIKYDSVEGVNIPILKVNAREFKLNKPHKGANYCELSFNKPVLSYTLIPTDEFIIDVPELYSNLSVDGKSIIIYNAHDSLSDKVVKAKLTVNDEVGNVISEVVDIEIGGKTKKDKEVATKKDTTKEIDRLIECTIYPKSGEKVPIEFIATILCTKPILDLDITKFKVSCGNESEGLKSDEIVVSNHRDMLTLKKDMTSYNVKQPNDSSNKKNEFTLSIEEGAFVTVDGEKNAQILNNYGFKKAVEYGTIRGTVNIPVEAFVIQLLDLKYNVIDEIKNEKKYKFNKVAPGDYLVRMLVLKDEDSQWMPGNIFKNEEPDPVVFYPHLVSVVANWEIKDIDLD